MKQGVVTLVVYAGYVLLAIGQPATSVSGVSPHTHDNPNWLAYGPVVLTAILSGIFGLIAWNTRVVVQNIDSKIKLAINEMTKDFVRKSDCVSTHMINTQAEQKMDTKIDHLQRGVESLDRKLCSLAVATIVDKKELMHFFQPTEPKTAP